jgi:transcriptional regulator with XRE-family HTH domain
MLKSVATHCGAGSYISVKNSLGRHWALQIDAAIKQKGLTKTKIAQRAKMKVRTLDRWLEPDPPDPRFSKVVAVCRILGISVESLLTASQKADGASSSSTAQILRTLATVLSDAAAAAEIDEQAPAGDNAAQPQVGASGAQGPVTRRGSRKTRP